ncbi:MAG: hypothetical protein ABSC48_15085 [Terracidiphilus sp.]|jgi:hypothetical protein
MKQTVESLANDTPLQDKVKQPNRLRLSMIQFDSHIMQLGKLFEKHRWLYGGIALLFGLSIMGVDYLLHPEAGRFQSQVAQELRSLPLPPLTTETDFTSGYQPSKGIAARKIITGISAKDICSFYRPVMADLGWQLVKEECYPSSEGDTLISFRKGMVTCAIHQGKEDGFSGTKYTIVSSWLGRPPKDHR